MPLYCYKCKACGFSFEVWHSMKFDDQLCTKCNSRNIFRIPSLPENIAFNKSDKKVGKVVNDYIEKTKKEIKKEKIKLKSEEL